MNPGNQEREQLVTAMLVIILLMAALGWAAWDLWGVLQ